MNEFGRGWRAAYPRGRTPGGPTGSVALVGSGGLVSHGASRVRRGPSGGGKGG